MLSHRAFEVTWETDGPPPNANFETFLLSLWITPRAELQLQFGLKFIAGEDPVVFLFDHSRSMQTNADHTHGLVGGNARQISVFFPNEWIPEEWLGQTLRGYWTVTRNGVDQTDAQSVLLRFPEERPDPPQGRDRALTDR